MTTTRIRPCGEAALLLDCADLAETVALAERIERAQTGAVDVVAAARTVLVTARDASELPRLRHALEALLSSPPAAPSLPRDSLVSPRSSLPSDLIRYSHRGSESAGRVADIGGAGAGSGSGAGAGSGSGAGAGSGSAAGAGAGETDSGETGRVVTLDVRYNGPDLADVAELAGVSVEALVRMHTSITWRAAFGGFAPGFFYLVDERDLNTRALNAREVDACDSDLSPLPTVPRLGSPRPRVPAGSVAVADRFCAVYPGASPGGWRLLGTTDAQLWDVNRPRPALLEPGTLVRFRDLGNTRGESARGGNPGDSGAAP